METERAKRLAGFVSWVGANIKQIFYSSLSVFDASPFAMGQDFSSSWNPGATS